MGKPAIHRRDFLKTAGQAAAAAATFSVPTPLWARSGAPGDRPNILVIMSDEHNPRVTGCYGSRIVHTPRLDQIAERGIAFDGCYTNSPLCVPSRLAFTSGKYVSRVSAWNNSCRLPSDDFPSIAHVMNAAGYESFLCGKMHYDRQHRYGFTEIGGNMNDSFMTGHGNRRAAGDLGKPAKLSPRFAEFHAGNNSSIQRHDRAVTAGALAFLSKRTRSEKPFYLQAGYLAPHFPLIVPQADWDPYRGHVPMPVIPPGHLESLPLNYKHLRAGFAMENVPADIVRKGRELYHGLVQWFDREAGKVLDALQAAGLANNTVVIYTADHGENMGEHGLWWKNCLFEHAARVPLLVSWPQRFRGGQRRQGACALVDVVRTIADLGGGRVPDDWNGTSLCPWMDDAHTAWKDMAVSQYYAHNIASGYAMLRSGQYKYVYHSPPDKDHPAQEELYDLQADPGEFHNLSGDAAQKERTAAMKAALIREVGEQPDDTEQRCRHENAQGYKRGGAPGTPGRGGKGRKGAGRKADEA